MGSLESLLELPKQTLKNKTVILTVMLFTRTQYLLIMKNLFLTLTLFPCFMACSDTEKTGSISTEMTDAKPQKSIAEKENILNAAKSFLKWYSAHPDLQNHLVKEVSLPDTNASLIYAVDFKATETYLMSLKQSGFVSDTYISHWRNYFAARDSGFKASPEAAGGVPSGFDFDFVTNSQDFEQELNTVDQAIITIIKEKGGLQKSITLQFPGGNTLHADVSYLNGKWLIDKTY